MLSLPTKIVFNNDDPAFSRTPKAIEYTYDATGVKLSKKVNENFNITNTQYAGNYIYENRTTIIFGGSTTTSELKFISQPEGYIEPNPQGGFDYVYQYKDHLGNVRLSYSDMNKDGVVAPANWTTVFSDDLENSAGWDSEGALYGWSAPIDTTKGHLDNSSVKLHRTVSGGYYAHSNEWIPINESEPTTYKFSGWVYVESSGYSWVVLSFFMNEDTETNYYTEVSQISRIFTKNQWVYLEQEVTVPVNIDKINLRVGLYNGSPSVTAWFDELRIERIGESEIVEESNYYPFGLKHKGYNNVVNGVHHPYGFGDKEENDELGFGTLDFGERNYDPSLGRWFNIDPFTEFMRNQSPYNFGFNNPIYFSDYGGTIPWPIPEFFKTWRRKNAPDEYFGYIANRGRNHNGLDLNYSGGGNTDLGAPIVATHSGKVTRIISLETKDGGGRVVVIESPDGSFQTKYMHLSSVVVQAGQEISEGQTIGLMGGSAFGKEKGRTVHLHYEIHKRNSNGSYSAINPWDGSQPIDPQSWIRPEPVPINYYNESDYQMALYDHENEGAMYENEDLIENNDMSPPAREREELSEIGITPSGLHEFDIPLPESDLRLPNNIPVQNQDYPINIPQRDSFWDRY
ncbi:peptidoglycan DD-metalloendopeptidase family protein [Flavobacteriaceae bacterium]|nr:peptidoglycan DD-metalloendopeptidase family protein [Flavobacteriaceae bacterium]